MSPDWERITVGKPTVEGVDVLTGRSIIRFPLSRTPPREWADHIASALDDIRDADTPKPTFKTDAITILAKQGEAELRGWIEFIEERVEQGNQHYLSSVIPSQEAKEDADRQRKSDSERQAEEAQRQIDEIYRLKGSETP